jgi:RNA polymerase sigma-70 factor, ECF subfamily
MGIGILTKAPVESREELDSRSDQELVAGINAGDGAAFEALYFRYRDWVVDLAFRFIGNEDLALDVMQETFLYLLRKFPGFRLTAQLKTFLYPAVKNLSISARKKAGRYQSTEFEKEALSQLPATEALPSRAADLTVVLAELSTEHREALLLRFVDGLTMAEIAEAVNVPLGTVKSRLHHALAALRQDGRTKEFFEQ